MNKNVWLTLMCGTAVGIVWFFVGRALLLRSEQCEWLSSFVEVAFALNAALTFEKVREWLNPLRMKFDSGIKEIGNRYHDKTRKKIIQYVQNHEEEVFDNCERMMRENLNWIVNLARLFAIISVIVLLGYKRGDYVMYIPCLIIPVVLYWIGTFFELLSMMQAIIGLFNDAMSANGVNR